MAKLEHRSECQESAGSSEKQRIYPGAFKSKQTQHNGYVVIESEIVRTGESWSHGPVILSWAHSQQGAANDTDGHNVVFHEFAHQIDDLSGRTDGVPNLGQTQKFSDWARVFEAGYKRHVQLVQRGNPTVIDAYGAEGYEEFFAVSVEVFFEKPTSLKREEPDVYEQLSAIPAGSSDLVTASTQLSGGVTTVKCTSAGRAETGPYSANNCFVCWRSLRVVLGFVHSGRPAPATQPNGREADHSTWRRRSLGRSHASARSVLSISSSSAMS